MQLKFFTFSVFETVDAEEQVNKFLRSVKVLEIKRDLVLEGDRSYWAICILYLSIAVPEVRNLINRMQASDSERSFRLLPG